MSEYETITKDEVEWWCVGTISNHAVAYLHEILTGEYDINQAREDILSFRPKEDEKE